LSFLQKCTSTSDRMSKWVLQSQEYDIHVSHISGTQNYLVDISGTQNYLADIISRHPAGLTLEQIKQLTRPRYIMMAAVRLNIDSQVKKELKGLAAYQYNVPYIKKTNKPASRSALLAV